MAGVDYSTMQILMKKYEFKKKEDICKILGLNKVKELKNAYEVVWKNVIKVFQKQTTDNLDMVMMDAHITPIILQNDSPFTLFRKDRKLCHICFVNVKNENEEDFSSLVKNLDKNDRIMIINGVISKRNVKLSNIKFTVGVRPENNSLVLLFKFGMLCTSISDNKSIVVKNLSQITHPGVYSFFGRVSKIIKYPNDYMSLRLLCSDRSCIKTLKYSHSEDVCKSNSSKEKNYDFNSKEVDILVKNPCAEFNSLVLNQRICLNDVKVKKTIYLDIFSLKVLGVNVNLNADPIETGSINSLRPPKRNFPLPNELKPPVKRAKVNQVKSSPIKGLLSIGNKCKTPSIGITDSSTDDDVRLLPTKKLPKKRITMVKSDYSTDEDDVYLPPTKKLPTLLNSTETSNLSNDDDVYLPSKKTLPELQSNHKIINILSENINTKPSTSFCRINKNNHNVQSKHKSSPKKMNSTPKISNGDQECNKINPISIQMCTEKNSSPEMFSNGSCSPPFFQNCSDVPKTFLSNQPMLSKQLHFNSTNPSVCTGPCRLIFTDPNIFCSEEIISGYCAKNCFSFISMTDLTICSRTKNYICPKCNDIISLSFFIKMNFLFGKNESSAIEVCCFGSYAQHVFKKLTKKIINVEDYLSNNDDRKLIIETLKTFINEKTKMNIVTCDSQFDQTKILLSVDTKYVVTTLFE